MDRRDFVFSGLAGFGGLFLPRLSFGKEKVADLKMWSMPGNENAYFFRGVGDLGVSAARKTKVGSRVYLSQDGQWLDFNLVYGYENEGKENLRRKNVRAGVGDTNLLRDLGFGRLRGSRNFEVIFPEGVHVFESPRKGFGYTWNDVNRGKISRKEYEKNLEPTGFILANKGEMDEVHKMDKPF